MRRGALEPRRLVKLGALIQIRTGDLVLTKNALCRLSYEGSLRVSASGVIVLCKTSGRFAPERPANGQEPERGFEPLTYRLQVGCATIAPPGRLLTVPAPRA